MVKVSVIVPVYRVEKYLDRCIRSLIGQTLKDIEIILVDDGSPDRCPEMCDEWAERDGRIRVIHKKNEGLGMARNSGMEAARGEFISFIDSDDYAAEDMLEVLYAAAVRHGAQMAMTGFCTVGGRMFSEEGTSIQYCFERLTIFSGREQMNSLMLALSGALPHEREDTRYGFSCWKNIYRTDVIRQNNIVFESERRVMSEDILFVLDFVSAADCAVGVPGAKYFYCRNDSSLSKSYRSGRMEAACVLLEEINSRLARHMPPEEYELYTDRFFEAQARVTCMQEIMFARANGLNGRELNRRLREYSNNPQLKKILKRYPIFQLPFKQAAFALAMRFSWVRLERVLVWLRK